MDSFCRVRTKIMYVLSWLTVSALPRVLFLCLLPALLRNPGKKHQNNPLASAETVRHLSTYIILYVHYIHIQPTVHTVELCTASHCHTISEMHLPILFRVPSPSAIAWPSVTPKGVLYHIEAETKCPLISRHFKWIFLDENVWIFITSFIEVYS